MHGSNLFIRNISHSVTIENLTDLFSLYGNIKNINFVQDRGFAFVEMSRQMDAEKAMKSLNGSEFQGRNIQVNEAISKKKKRR